MRILLIIALATYFNSSFSQILPCNCLDSQDSSVIKVGNKIVQLNMFIADFTFPANDSVCTDITKCLKFWRDGTGCRKLMSYLFGKTDSMVMLKYYDGIIIDLHGLDERRTFNAHLIKEFVAINEVFLLIKINGLGLTKTVALTADGKYFLLEERTTGVEINEINGYEFISMIKAR